MHQVQSGRERLTIADGVTAMRFVLAAAIGVLGVAGAPLWVLGVLAASALLSDFVDGRLARATGTATALGARLDAEADAVLILVLSALASASIGWWVLGLGLARYVFGALFSVVPALSTPPSRPRAWCRVVAALVGVVLGVVLVFPLLPGLERAAVAAVAILLAESFLHEAVDRWLAPGPPLSIRVGTVLALGVVWVALAAPTSVAGLARLPLGVALVVAIALMPHRKVRLALALLIGIVLGALLVLAVLDAGFTLVFDRDFDLAGDWSYFGPGVGVLGDSIGAGWAVAVAVLSGLAAVAVLAGVVLAVIRVVRVARATMRREPRRSGRALVVLAVVAALCSAAGLPIVDAGAAEVGVDRVQQVRADLADHRAFARAIASDPFAARAPGDLLAGLAGKDVLVVFVESYGRVAVQDTSYAPGIGRVLDAGTKQLGAAGYRVRSGFLTSPTFGAGSWLAHATLQSGLWVDSQQRYRQLLGNRRMTLTSLFGAAGWHTVFDVPADTEDWPEGAAFYGFADYDDSRNVGYAGPKFGYAPVPDQYTLARFRRTYLAPAHRLPVMAEIDLVSSHHPWTPLPAMIGWQGVGDGSIFHDPSARGPSAGGLSDDATVRRMYGKSIEYTWQVLTSFLTTYPDPDLVLIVAGDHQPHGYVSGRGVGHDVPVSVIAQDPAVFRRIAGWGWQPGLRPTPSAPVWRMDAFRDRFLAAFGR